MSAPTAHGHGHDDGAVHAHVSSTFFYIAVFSALICLTLATVGQSYVDLGKLNLLVVILIASLKASLVVAFFMHLRWDNKFNALIFVSALFFIGVFFTYTMNDTERRGELDADQNVRVLPKNGENAPGGFEPKSDEHGAGGPGAAEHGTPGTAPTAGKGGDSHGAAPAATTATPAHH
jgi:cytochrome c oxidase subunit IV